MNNKTIDKLDKITDTIWELMKGCFRFFITMVNAVITIMLLTGSFITFILLYKLYPGLFIKVMNALDPVVDLLWAIFRALYWLALILCILFIIFSLAEIIARESKKSKKKREIKRERFLDDLATKMNKRLKKK